MKVEFSIDEVATMMDSVIDELAELNLSKTDRAKLRRWRADEMGGGSALMQLLAQKVNEELDRTHLIDPDMPSGARRKVNWAHPAFANRSIYVRGNRELICASLAAPSSK